MHSRHFSLSQSLIKTSFIILLQAYKLFKLTIYLDIMIIKYCNTILNYLAYALKLKTDITCHQYKFIYIVRQIEQFSLSNQSYMIYC